MSDVLDTTGQQVRALDAQTLCAAFQTTASERPGQVAHRTLDGGTSYTWSEYAERVRAIATGLHSLGVRRGDTVAAILVNRPEFALADVAAMHLGAVGFSVYNSLTAEQVNHVFRNSGARVVVTERAFLPRVLEARTAELEHIVLVDGEAEGAITLVQLASRPSRGFRFEDAWREVTPDDVATLIYTSGTTGPPKAVQLTHGGVMFAARAYGQALPFRLGARGFSYLPTAHIADRVGVHYLASICAGAEVISLPDYRQLGAALPAVHPTAFGGVPRIWEKIKAGLEAAGVHEPARLPEAVKAAVRARVGLDEVEYCISGAAPASPEVLNFFGDLGIKVLETWGMSECSWVVIVNRIEDARVGTVGRPLPGVEVTLAEDGELLVRGPMVMKGYRGDPEQTAEAIDPQGWLHTGDIARIDDDGYVSIVDRKKEIIINSAGKNMSPANIEFHLRASSPLISQAVCIGDRRPYNVALLVLDPEASARWAAQRGLPTQVAMLSQHPDLRAEIAVAVESANAGLSRVEQIKRFAVLGVEWVPGGDELTPTIKLKRKPISEKYAVEIERLYS